MNFVYLLSDPRDVAPRYVGITNNLNRRINKHLYGSDSPYCSNWVKSLRNLGLVPIVEVLETVEDYQREDAEQAWILGFRQAGASLTNLTNGGEGSPGHKHTKETIEKMRGSRRKTGPQSLVHRRRISKSMTGKQNRLGTIQSEEARTKIKKSWEARMRSK